MRLPVLALWARVGVALEFQLPVAGPAWLAPFPPGVNRASEPSTVAPGPGSRGTVTEMSMFRLPSTVTFGRLVMAEP